MAYLLVILIPSFVLLAVGLVLQSRVAAWLLFLNPVAWFALLGLGQVIETSCTPADFRYHCPDALQGWADFYFAAMILAVFIVPASLVLALLIEAVTCWRRPPG